MTFKSFTGQQKNPKEMLEREREKKKNLNPLAKLKTHTVKL